MRITVLAGGVGGARFLRGLVHHLRTERGDARSQVTVIGNTGDDITLHGLRICPDLDTVLYTLGGAVDEVQGWGRDCETHAAQAELSALGVEPQWFSLGDRDLGTHIARSRWLGQGVPLSEVTSRLATRWGLPEQGVRLLPVTDTPVETHVILDDGHATERAVHFQQWWVQMGAAVPAQRFVVAGLDRAVPAPGVLEAVRGADLVLLPPSNPVVSIGIILGVPGVRDALRGTRAPVVGVSPIIGGAPVRGHADACLAPLGVEVSAAGVAGLYADFLDGWLVDDADRAQPVPADNHRVRTRARGLRMRDVPSAAGIAGEALDLALELAADAPGATGA
ncbi:MAG: 2-phospho-L-lactate transferase [Ornithinimicrobium sp.]|uniref:2-phospho-L-lactate transferase n=1 Tax=Ornithinimicrobium sp. TaxID=1977084 RepID=UPI0017FA66C7|nr:2-phospho-L-lactate transferase [Actinomycetota bacterium]